MRKRIAFLTMSADTHYIQDLIRTMGRQAADLGYELLVVTHFVNYIGDSPYIAGEENIYAILRQIHVDGAILAGGTYYDPELPARLEELLLELHIPTVALDCESRHFPSCFQQSTAPFRMLTEHFITEHGFTDIACLTGPQGNFHAEQRLAGYREALAAHGIPYREKRTFYGDFWMDSGKELAQRIISGEIPKPQAVVCGNDYMALTLCLTLMSAGIRVPEEIAVGGYDGTPDIAHFHPSLTTVVHAYLQTGAEAVCRLHEQITGTPAQPVTLAPELKIGASCGCRASLPENAALTQVRVEESQQNLLFMHSAYSSVMSSIRSLTECAWSIEGNFYLLQQDSGFQVWLCTDWQGSQETPEEYRREGYSRKMLRILARQPDGSIHAEQQTGKPDSIPAGEQPSVWFLTPLHFQDRCLGLCVRRFQPEQAVFERYYGEFCQVIANSLERLRMLELEQAMQRQIEHLSERDILTGLYSRTGLEKRLRELPEALYFAVLLDLGTLAEYSERTQKQITVTFAQAVNLSCIRGEISARLSAGRFVIVGKCDGSDRPEQLVLHNLHASLAQLESQQGLHFSRNLQRIAANGAAPAELLARLEQQLSARQDSETHQPYHAALRALREQIYEAPQLDWNAETQAQTIGISLSHFQHLYQECHEVSFHADLIAARMALAGQLLCSTSLSVSEIAARCGFADVSYFMKVFKKRMGTTARKYRKARETAE